jgi:hypothetical protein
MRCRWVMLVWGIRMEEMLLLSVTDVIPWADGVFCGEMASMPGYGMDGK